MIDAPRTDPPRSGCQRSRTQGRAQPRTRLPAHPQSCLLCQRYSPAPVCGLCADSLALNNPACNICALPLPQPNLSCPECLSAPPGFAASVIPWRYSYPLDHLLRRFKDQGDLVAGRWLSDAWCEQWRTIAEQALAPSFDAIVAVPCHWRQRLRRGFSPSEFIAQRISQQLERPLLAALTKTRPSIDQRTLDRRARLANLTQAFCAQPQRLAGAQHILLVDDVVTTGATARLTSDLLRRAGATQVTLAALARVSK